jgi:hypothetical protein
LNHTLLLQVPTNRHFAMSQVSPVSITQKN